MSTTHPEVAGARPTLPAWRSLLEERWHERLSALTARSLAYHDAESSDGVRQAGGRAGTQSARLTGLLREATAARRALSDTEEALARLSGGDFGRCEQCSVLIPSARLLAEPEARYCADCVQASGPGQGERHRGARPFGAGGGQLAAVRPGEFGGDREADAAA